jgi:hypothetical protein
VPLSCSSNQPTHHLGGITISPEGEEEFVDPLPAICTPESLQSLSKILIEYENERWYLGKIQSLRTDRTRFGIKWNPTNEHPQETHTIEQLLPLGDPMAKRFKIPATELNELHQAMLSDGERGNDAVRRSVRTPPSFLISPEHHPYLL